MSEDLTALLTQLREKDPETWDKFEVARKDVWMIQNKPYCEIIGNKFHNYLLDDHLAGCLQRACSKQRWKWMLSSFGHDGRPKACIFGMPFVEVVGSGPSPAHALLAAYLQALP